MDKILNNPSSIVLISSIGALYLLGLINTEIFAKSYKEIKLYDDVITKNDLLRIATFSLYYNLESNKGN